MKEVNDEGLQHLAEQSGLINTSLSSEQQRDVFAYQSLFNRLKAEPANGLPFDFAANVRRTMQQQAIRKNELKFNVMLFVVFIAILASAFGLLYLISPASSEQLLTMSPRLKWSVGLALLAFWSIQLGSQSLLKNQKY